MIQRIQTIYLLAATSLMMTFLFSPLATFASSEEIYTMSTFNIKGVDGATILSLPYLMIISVLAAILPLVNIFLFKKRMLQIRLCVVQIILAVGALLIAGVHYYLTGRTFGAEVELVSSIRIVCALPIVALLFDFLALKAIFKDELLIKSLDRIR